MGLGEQFSIDTSKAFAFALLLLIVETCVTDIVGDIHLVRK